MVAENPKRKRVQSLHEEIGFFRLRSLDPDAHVVTRFSAPSVSSMYLWSDRVYTVGRESGRCDITFVGNRHISKQHCQFLLDRRTRKLVVVDGVMDLGFGECLPERCSLNGVFVNGRRIEKGSRFELSAGNEVLLACGASGDCLNARCGFVVEKIVFLDTLSSVEGGEEASVGTFAKKLRGRELMERAVMLQSVCRNIRLSVDPVSCILSLDADGFKRKKIVEKVAKKTVLGNIALQSGEENITFTLPNSRDVPELQFQRQCASEEPDCREVVNDAKEFSVPMYSEKYSNRNENSSQHIEYRCSHIPSDGKAFFLNRLHFMDPELPDHRSTISLPELLQPLGNVARMFIATFTCDVSWFLSFCKIPNHLPITIACHDTKRCWDASSGSRMSMPFTEYPNLVLLFPPFPESIAFGVDRKRQGVGCHHPKLIILQRDGYMRVIITSANLVSRQWNNITNTVWWQDFPRRDCPDFSHFFTCSLDYEKDHNLSFKSSDFAAQLAGFIACLIADVPQEVHWISELARYDFEGASGYLVASVPGIHTQNDTLRPDYVFSLSKIVRTEYVASNFIGCVHSSVVGISHLYRTAADSNGLKLRNLASLLKKNHLDDSTLLEVFLKRVSNIPADSNAVSVVVADFSEASEGECVQLGFLPRDVAKWVAPLSDGGYFAFSAFLFPKEALAAAFEGSNIKVQLIIHLSQGPNFSTICQLLYPELLPPLCLLLASLGRCMGLSRLQEILCRYNWPEPLETDFVYGCSSIGTSICPQYLASFSAAAGKRSHQHSESESDPEWGCWTTDHELRSPSLEILFPTIERVKEGPSGIHSYRYMLALSEKTWQRLKHTSILHDAIPNPRSRVGHPMHIKVACRRFQLEKDLPSFGWIYCGSHNFSPAAWGQFLQGTFVTRASQGIAWRLHICNYELGILFVVPPPKPGEISSSSRLALDDISLPFVLPAPRYKYNDRPATAQAMREVAIVEKEIVAAEHAAAEDLDEENSDEEMEPLEYFAESNEEKIYADMLWSQVDCSES